MQADPSSLRGRITGHFFERGHGITEATCGPALTTRRFFPLCPFWFLRFGCSKATNCFLAPGDAEQPDTRERRILLHAQPCHTGFQQQLDRRHIPVGKDKIRTMIAEQIEAFLSIGRRKNVLT